MNLIQLNEKKECSQAHTDFLQNYRLYNFDCNLQFQHNNSREKKSSAFQI